MRQRCTRFDHLLLLLIFPVLPRCATRALAHVLWCEKTWSSGGCPLRDLISTFPTVSAPDHARSSRRGIRQ